MNWNDIKKGLSSKPAKIIYAVIVIAAIMTAVGFGIYYLYGLLTQGDCQPGQYYHEGDGACYPGECANDCKDDNAERNWNKENKTCDCACIDGYNNNNIDKKCNPECAKGTSCDSGQTCAIVSDSCGNSKKCIDTSASNYQKCGDLYCDKNGGVKCDDDKQVCVANGTVKCKENNIQACIVGEKKCPNGDDCNEPEKGGDDSPFFNKFREEGSKLGYCNAGPNCCADNKITLKLLEGGKFCPYCCTDDTNPCIADDYTPSGCCKNTPCNDGRCPIDGKTVCTPDGVCPINEVYKHEDGTLGCCRDETVYKTFDGKVTCPEPGKKVSTITDEKYAPLCSKVDDCNGIPNSQCISILDKTGNFDDSRCRAICGKEYVLTADNQCIKADNICDWNLETGTAKFTPEAKHIGDDSTTPMINICKTDDKKLWWRPNTNGEQLDNYKLNAVINAKSDKCQSYGKEDLKKSCGKFLSGELATTTGTADLIVSTAEETKGDPTCTFNIDCCKLPGTLGVSAPPSNKESFRNWMSIENFGNFEDKTDEETPCVKGSKLTDNKWWVNQTLDPIYISAQWDGQKYDTLENSARFYPLSKNGGLNRQNYSFLNTGEFCNTLSLTGTSCDDFSNYTPDKLCPITQDKPSDIQYTNNVQCNFPRQWSCRNSNSPIYGWNSDEDNCCKNGILSPINSTGDKQPICKSFTFNQDVSYGTEFASLKFKEIYTYKGSSNLDIYLLNNSAKNGNLKLTNSLCIFREAHSSSHLYLSLKMNSNHTYSFQLTSNPDLTIFYNIDTNIKNFYYPGGLKFNINITTIFKKPLFMNFDTKYTNPNYLKNELINIDTEDDDDYKYNSVFPACFKNSLGGVRIIIVAVHIEYYEYQKGWNTTNDTIHVLCRKTNGGGNLAFRTFHLSEGSLQTQLGKEANFRPLELNGVTLPHILDINNPDSADYTLYHNIKPTKYTQPSVILNELNKKT